MSAKTYLRIIQAGLIASFLIVFFVFEDLLFPYITSKQLSFNILMEFLFAFWLVFIWRYPSYRPRRSYLTWGLSAYLLAVLASCAVSVDYNLSFWGDAERMLGVFHLFHFFLLYLLLISTFRSWREWRWLLTASVVVAAIVSVIGLRQAEVYSTIGNTAYVSGYLIFNLYFCFLLFNRGAGRASRWFYLIPAAIMLLEFASARTSGAIIGLTFSLLLMAAIYAFSHPQRVWRRGAALLLLAAVAAGIIIFTQREAAWFQGSYLRNLTTQKHTFQTRLISWRGAARDFPNHPIFGTGFGNYAITFDRHFDSKFYDYAKTETYFDRAHNNLIDITSTTGIVGLLTYLSIFAAVAFYLRRQYVFSRAVVDQDGGLRYREVVILVSLLAAYFIQNLAVFDSYVTYVGLMVTLAFIYWLDRESQEGEEEARPARWVLADKHQWTAIILILAAAYLFASYTNIRPWKMFAGTIDGYARIMSGDLIGGYNSYYQALRGTPLDRDARSTLINLVTSNPPLLSQLTTNQAQVVLDYAISLAEKNVAYNPHDSLLQMQLAQVLDTAARFYYQDLERFNAYSSRAVVAMERAVEASPGRATVYFAQAQMLLFRGDIQEALAAVEHGISLNPNYPEGHCRLAQFNTFLVKQEGGGVTEDDVRAAMDRCVDLGGAPDINSSSLLTAMLDAYTSDLDFERALPVAERFALLYGDHAEIWFNLAKLYLVTNNTSQADAAAARAMAMDPALEDDWRTFRESVPASSLNQ